MNFRERLRRWLLLKAMEMLADDSPSQAVSRYRLGDSTKPWLLVLVFREPEQIDEGMAFFEETAKHTVIGKPVADLENKQE